ncbi:hypothetical protein [Paenibacillus alba]
MFFILQQKPVDNSSTLALKCFRCDNDYQYHDITWRC